MSARTVDVRLSLAEQLGCEVVSCRVVEGISEHVHATVVLSATEHLQIEDVLLQQASLELLLDGEVARKWHLSSGYHNFLGVTAGAPRYVVELFDPLWCLRLGKTTRKFRNLTTQAIVSKVLDENGVAHVWRASPQPAPRNYCVQYRETHLDFVRRLLAFEGIYHTVDEDGTLILADTSPSSPPVPGQSRFDLSTAAGALDSQELGIYELRRRARLAPGLVSLNDANWKNPSLSLLSHRAADRDVELAVYDFPANFRDPREGQRLAQLRLEAHRATVDTVEGKSNVAAFAPALAFTFGDAAGETFAGDYLLVHVEHTMHSAGAPLASAGGATSVAAGALTYKNSFSAIPLNVPFRPQPLQRPSVAGNHSAMVRGPSGSEIHTDVHGRFKAQFHWDREAAGSDEDSRWMRMLQESATSMFLARVGWEVDVGYIDGDPDRPVGLGRNINGVMTPTYAQPASKNVMAMKTPSSPASGGYNELKLDDSGQGMRFDMRAEKDFLGLVKNDQTEAIGNDEMHIVGASLTQGVAYNQSITVGVDSSTTSNESVQLDVANDRVSTVGANEKIDVGAAQTVSVSGNDSEKVGSLRITLSGSVGSPAAVLKSMIPSPKSAAMGMFQGAAQGAMSGAMGAGSAAVAGGAGIGGTAGAAAGGAASGAASGAMGSLSGMIPSASSIVSAMLQGSISRSAKKGITRTVGGAFISVAVGAYSTSVQAAYLETVGGAKLTLSGESITQNSGKLHVTTVGGAILRTSAKAMSMSSLAAATNVGGTANLVSAEKVLVEGAKVRIQAGAGLSLSAGGGAIDMKPGSMAWSGDVKIEADTVKLKGAVLNLTK